MVSHLNMGIQDRIKRRSFGMIAIGIFISQLRCTPTETNIEPDPKPNVIVIFTDDHNFNQTGCYGGNVSTPNMDKLAAEGVRFTRYYPCTSLCSPSRYSVLTGRYPSRCLSFQQESSPNEPVFIRWNSDILKGETTIAHLMKEQGYATGFTGKWHNWDWSTKDVVLRHVADRDDPENPVVNSVIEKNYQVIREQVKKTSGFDFVEAVYGTNFNWLPITEKLMNHNQHWITYHSLKFIEQNKDKPFFLYLATTLPHAPGPLQSLRGDPRATPAGYQTEHLNCQPSYESILKRAGEAGITDERELSEWAAMCWLDDGVGAITQKLDELGLRENTLIILASDNDTPGKMTCNNGPIPMIVNWKNYMKGGQVCDELVSNVDVVPTVLDAAGIEKSDVKIDGISFLPLLQGANDDWRKSLYLEVTYTRGVVTKNYKYIATRFPGEIQEQLNGTNLKDFTQEGVRIQPGSPVRYNSAKKYPGYFDAEQLYDLHSDSLEQHNLAKNPDYEKPLEEMKQELKSYCEDMPFAFGEFKSN